MNFKNFDSFTSQQSFREYCTQFSYEDKANYLKFLEDTYPEIAQGSYSEVFCEYNIQLLLEQKTELITRIFFLYSEYKSISHI